MGLFSKSIVGLEMDSKEIRAVEVKGSIKKPEISAWGKVELPEGIVKDGRVLDPKKLTIYLDKLWNDNGFKSKDVFLGINNQDVIVRFASFPKVPEDKVRNMIMFQAQEFIPVSLDDLQLDYVIVGEKKTEDGEFLNVILVGARKKMLNDYIEALKASKLRVKEIDSGLLAIGRAALSTAQSNVFAAIGFNHDIANIMIFNKGILSMARSISFTQSSIWTSRKLGEASEVNKDENIIADILLGELKSSVGYYRMQSNDNVEAIHLIGQFKVKEIVDRFAVSGFEAKALEPYTSLETNVTAKNLRTFKASDFVVSISLALRGLEE